MRKKIIFALVAATVLGGVIFAVTRNPKQNIVTDTLAESVSDNESYEDNVTVSADDISEIEDVSSVTKEPDPTEPIDIEVSYTYTFLTDEDYEALAAGDFDSSRQIVLEMFNGEWHDAYVDAIYYQDGVQMEKVENGVLVNQHGIYYTIDPTSLSTTHEVTELENGQYIALEHIRGIYLKSEEQ